MFIDDYGNEFKTEEEVEDFARKKFYENEDDLIDYIETDFTIAELLNWIFKNDKEKFMNEYKNIFKSNESLYAHDYFFNYGAKEIED